MWSLRSNDTNKLTYKTGRDLENKLMFAEGEGTVQIFGEVMYTLLYLRWITNRGLLYSTWNSAQCYMPDWMGGGLGENTYIYMYG